MDILKNYNIAWKGLSNGKHDFKFDIDDRFFEAFGDTEIKGGSLTADISVDRSATMLMLETVIEGSVTVECDRCLESLSIPVDFEGRLKVKFSDEINEYDGDVMWISPSEGELELAQYIYESIVLSLPYQRVHGSGPDGKPLCNEDMLTRFGIISQEELDELEAESNTKILGEDPAMQKLAALKSKLEKEEKK